MIFSLLQLLQTWGTYLFLFISADHYWGFNQNSNSKMATADVITTIIRRNRPGTKAAVGSYFISDRAKSWKLNVLINIELKVIMPLYFRREACWFDFCLAWFFPSQLDYLSQLSTWQRNANICYSKMMNRVWSVIRFNKAVLQWQSCQLVKVKNWKLWIVVMNCT